MQRKSLHFKREYVPWCDKVPTLTSFCFLSSSIPVLAVQNTGTTTFSRLFLSSPAFFLTLPKVNQIKDFIRNYNRV